MSATTSKRRQKPLADRFGDPYGTLVDPGKYRCFYRGVERGFVYGVERQYCWFTLSPDEEGAEKPLIRFYNPICKPFVPRTHNIFKDYWALTGRLPSHTVKPDDYLSGCELLVSVVTVHEKNAKGRKNGARKNPGPPYSKIDALIKITLGTPPCLQRGSSRAS